MNRRFATASIIVMVLTIARAQAAAAQEPGQEAHEFNAPLDFVIQNPCSGEVVAIEGNADLLLQVTASNSTLLLKTHTAITGKGIAVADPMDGPTVDDAIRYTFGDEFDDEIHIMGDTVILTTTRSIHLTSAGRTDNFALKFLIHTNVDANGAFPAISKVTCECRGSSFPEPEEVECVLPPPVPPAQ
jgi:hypothetical protein